jgi:hypothetical protein
MAGSGAGRREARHRTVGRNPDERGDMRDPAAETATIHP